MFDSVHDLLLFKVHFLVHGLITPSGGGHAGFFVVLLCEQIFHVCVHGVRIVHHLLRSIESILVHLLCMTITFFDLLIDASCQVALILNLNEDFV